MTYGILSAERDEIGSRYYDFKQAYKDWQEMYETQICFLVEWLTRDWYRVIEPK